MTEDEFVAQAVKDFHWLHAKDEISTVKEACEAYYMNGFSDEVSGDVECGRTGHFYRVDRWLVLTDSQGFSELETFESEDEAKARFEDLDKDYALWEAQ